MKSLGDGGDTEGCTGDLSSGEMSCSWRRGLGKLGVATMIKLLLHHNNTDKTYIGD